MTTRSLLPRAPLRRGAAARPAPVAPERLAAAAAIVTAVADGGEPVLREYAERYDRLAVGAPLLFGRDALAAASEAVPDAVHAVLERTAERIERFARAQRAAIGEVERNLGDVVLRQRVFPVERAGCYAPGGRYAYPSSVLMTAVTARAAGVREVIVASPAPSPLVLAAAHVAGADAVLAAGGAHAIAALAHGAGVVGACDAVVGPGNSWVTAAKQLVAGLVRIDALAGPSELVVVADASADAARVAADLIAQAEHDPEARTTLVTFDPALDQRVRDALESQLATLTSAAVARAALERGATLVVASEDEAWEQCERLAPEHLQLVLAEPAALATRLRSYGALFIGDGAAEVFGDYGAGPNHVLPTGGSARAFSGLSVQTFLRAPTVMEDRGGGLPQEVIEDARALAELEALPGHAAAARARLE